MKIISNIFIILIIIITFFLIGSVLPISNNYKLLIVQSGSMQPSIKNGSLVLVKPAEDYKIGEIITFCAKAEDVENVETRHCLVSTTHRIADMRVQAGVPIYMTKGDANDAPDSWEVLPNEIIGKVWFDLPYLGYVIDFIKKPLGFMLIILIPAVVIIWGEVKKITKTLKH